MTGTLWWLPRILGCDELDATNTLLMIALADHVDADDMTFVGIRRLADAARCSYPTAKRRLAELSADGWIVRERNRRTDGNLSTYSTRLVRERIEPGITVSPDQGSPGRALTRDHPDDPAEVPSGEQPSEEQTSTSVVPTNDDPLAEWSTEVREVTSEFARMVRANGHPLPAKGSKAATGWLREMDRLLRLGPPGDTGEDPPPTPAEVRQVMTWALTVSDFWPPNIRSVPKFREQYTRLRGQASRQNGQNGRGAQLADGYAAAAERLRSRT